MRAARTCSICPKPHEARGFCRLHYGRFIRTGNPLGMRKNGRPPAAEPTFNTVHRRLHKARGFAKNLRCVDCGQQALDWSLSVTGGPTMRTSPEGFDYSLDLGDYLPRCRRCHMRHDRKPVQS